MPYLDCSDILLDPDFCDSTLQCQRLSSTVNNQGQTVTSSTLIGFAGVVTSDRGELLDRGIVGEHAVGTISVITKFLLRDAVAGATADIVQWNGKQFTVVKVNDYSTFGRGFVEAICELKPLAG